MLKVLIGTANRAGACLRPDVVCLLLGLAGVLPMIVLTPPFQVPDEQEHFHRAYQLSEFQLRGIEQNGRAGGILPSSLIELSEAFLGTRAIHTERHITAQPLRRSWMAMDRPLEPDRREFVDFTSTSFYSPLGYLPQTIAIVVGRSLGAGPLALLYLARLANSLATIALLTWAVRLMPIGREATMAVALLPMAIFEYASVSPDAAVIGTTFLFTANALRAQLVDGWSSGRIAVAAVSALVFCTQKPVYAPLLVLAFPSVLDGYRAARTILAHVVIITVAVGGTALWLHDSPAAIAPLPGMSVPGQTAYIAAHPFTFLKAVTLSQVRYFHFYYKSTIGILGWLTLSLPAFAYLLPAGALLLCFLMQPRDTPRLSASACAWNILVLAGCVFLVLTSQYLIFTQVGAATVVVQGRYFIPLLPLAIATSCSIVPWRVTQGASRIAFLAVTVVAAVEIVTADIAIVRAYRVL
jgi:uncharacterized membrane protein